MQPGVTSGEECLEGSDTAVIVNVRVELDAVEKVGVFSLWNELIKPRFITGEHSKKGLLSTTPEI